MAKKGQYSLRFKIWFGFLLVNIIFVFTIVWALWQEKQMAVISTNYLELNRPIILKLFDIRDNLNKSIQVLQAYALFNDKSYAAQSKDIWDHTIIPRYNEINQDQTIMSSPTLSEPLRLLLSVDLKSISTIRNNHDTFISESLQKGLSQAILNNLKTVVQQMMDLDDKINNAIATQESLSSQRLNDLHTRLQQLMVIGSVLLGMGILLSVLFIIVISSSITRPIQKMTSFTRNLANGDLNNRLELSASKEFEELSETLNLVVSSLDELANVSDNIAMGDHSHRVIVKSELDRLGIAINKMLGNFDKIVEQAYAISEGNFTSEIKPRSANDKLGKALAHMTKTLRMNKKVSTDQHWLQEGLNQLAALLSEKNEVRALSEITLNTLCHYIQAGMGAIYIKDEHEPVLHLSAGFAIAKTQRIKESFSLGEELIGQVGTERKTLIIKDIHSVKKSERFSSTMDSATHSFPSVGLYIAPLLYEKKLIGVIEINFYNPIREIDIQLLKDTAPLIAGHLRSAQQQEISNQLVKEIERASEYKSEFLANMSHELRTPLNSLIILTKLLISNSDNNLNSDQMDSLKIIHHSAEDLLYLINDILDLSKVEAGKLEIQYGDVELTTLKNLLSSQFSHVANDKNIAFTINIDEDLPQKMVSDEHRLLQILRNLIGNAIKFTHEGSVTLTIRKPVYHPRVELFKLSQKNCIQFDVVDSGIGISAEHQKFIFEPFRQADGSTSRRYGGTGLGLSISLKLANLLGGFIDVVSQENKGSTFSLYLPIGITAERENIKTISHLSHAEQSMPAEKSVPSAVPEKKVSITNLPWQVVDDIPEQKFPNSHIAIVSSHLKSSFSFANLLQKHDIEVEKIANLNQLQKYLVEKKSFELWFIDSSLVIEENLIEMMIHNNDQTTVLCIDGEHSITGAKQYHILKSEKDTPFKLSAIMNYLGP